MDSVHHVGVFRRFYVHTGVFRAAGPKPSVCTGVSGVPRGMLDHVGFLAEPLTQGIQIITLLVSHINNLGNTIPQPFGQGPKKHGTYVI